MSINKQHPPNTTPTSDHAELDIAFEDAGGLSAAGYQKQASVRFGSSPVPQGFEAIMSLAALGIFGAQRRGTAQFALAMLLGSLSDAETKASSPSQLLAATVDTLIEANEDQLFASLTDVNRQQLIATLDKLIDVVGEDESHFLAPLMHFIGNLIQKYEEQSTMTNWTESLDREESEVEGDASLRIPMRGLAAAYGDDEPEYTLDMLTEINPDYAGLDENGEISLRIPARGLEAAYSNDEPEYTLECLFPQILTMMNNKPITERDVILVYFLGDTQTFLKRIQVYLKTKQKLIGLPPVSLPTHRGRVEIVGCIGSISSVRHRRLLKKLGAYLKNRRNLRYKLC